MSSAFTDGDVARVALASRYAPRALVCAERAVEDDLARTNAPSLVKLLRKHAFVGGLNRLARLDAENPSRVLCVNAMETRVGDVADDAGADDGLGSAFDRSVATRARCAVARDVDDCASVEVRWRERAHEMGARARAETEASRARFRAYADVFERALRCNDIEACDHPLAGILCVYARETYEDVVDALEGQKKRMFASGAFASGAADPGICFGKCVVWNAKCARGLTRAQAEDVVKRVQQTGAWDCELLTVNTNEQGDGSSEIWREAAANGGDGPSGVREGDANASVSDLGKWMSDKDIECARNYMRTFTTKTLLPHIEQKLFTLSTQILNTRKGLRNQFKTFWGRSAGTTKREGESDAYTHASPESQVRLAGDLAFMCRDYEAAMAHYRLAHADYKSQSAWRHLGSSYEAMAHVHLLSRANSPELKKDIDHAYQQAIASYAKFDAATGGTQSALATRLKIRASTAYGEALRALGAHRESNLPFIQASAMGDDDLRAALMLEQAAFSFLQCVPPMTHKFASYMVLAGARYYRADAIAGATRCYAYALPMFSGKGWSAAEEHLNTTLGHLVSRAGRTRNAMEFFRDATRCAHLPADLQSERLSEFEGALEAYVSSTPAVDRNDRADELECPLPHVNVGDVHVTFADDRESHETSGSDSNESAWTVIEQGGIIPASLTSSVSTTNWLQGGRAKFEIDQTDVCAAGEDLKIDVTLTNPLHIPLDVRNVRLIWDFTPSGGECSTVQTNNEGERPDGLVRTTFDHFTLAPASKLVARLTVMPSTAGTLRVLGIAWTTGSKQVAHGRRYFDVKAPRTRRGPNGEWLRDVPKHRRLVFNVCETVPRCEGALEMLPEYAMDGSLQRVDLVVSNVTQPMAKWIRVRLPKSVLRPVDASYATENELAMRRNASQSSLQNVASPLRSAQSKDLSVSVVDSVDSDGVVYALPEWETLVSGATIRWPLWFHPCGVGKCVVHISVCYQPEPPAPKLLQYRTIRIVKIVNVTPSLTVNAQALPASTHPLARVVCMSVASVSDETFTLGRVQLGSSSTRERSKYELKPLMANQTSLRMISAGEIVETLFKCTPSEDAEAYGTESFDFFGATAAEFAEPLFAFHNSRKKSAFGSRRAGTIDDGIMVTWTTRDGTVFGAHHVAEVPEVDHVGNAPRAPSEARGKISWTIEHINEVELDQSAPERMTCVPITLRVRNESAKPLDIAFVAEATSSAAANIEGSGWSLEPDKDAWQNREVVSLSALSVAPPPTSSITGESVRRPIPLPPGKPVLWIGPVKRVIKSVAPGAVVYFPLTAACFAKGDHVLDGYSLTWTESAPTAPALSPPLSPRSRSPTASPRRAPPLHSQSVCTTARAEEARNHPYIIVVK